MYATKSDLLEAYRIKLELDGMSSMCAKMVSEQEAVYVPHKYRGGYVIRNFGFSIDRIGKYVLPSNAGNPREV